MDSSQLTDFSPGFNGGPQSSLRDILYVVFRHKWKMIAFFFAVSLPITVYVLLQAEIYESEAKILIKLRSESVGIDAQAVSPMMGSGGDPYRTQQAILQSRTLAEQVVDRIGPEAVLGKQDEASDSRAAIGQKVVDSLKRLVKGFPAGGSSADLLLVTPREKAIRKVAANLSSTGSSNVVTITYQDLDPCRAHDILSCVVDTHLQRHIEINKPEVSPEFYEQQCAVSQVNLEVKEQELEQLQSALNVDSIDENISGLLSKISEIETSIATLDAEINGSNVMIAFIEDRLRKQAETEEGASEPIARTSPTAQFLRQRLVELKLQEADLSSKYQENARPLVDLRKQMESTQVALREEEKELEQQVFLQINTGITPTLQTPEIMLETERAQLASRNAQREALAKQLASCQADLKTLRANEGKLKKLDRDVQDLEQTYSVCRANLERARTTVALEEDRVSNLRVIQPATMPTGPKQTRKERYRNIALGIFLGLFGSIGLAFFLEYLDHSMKTPSDVEKRLGLPVLATISYKEFKSCI
jgi:uncharacterized protein involved in exopolysaccharide biosynthesis